MIFITQVRIASEGVNITIGSSDYRKIHVFIECFKKHPLFIDMTNFEFKVTCQNLLWYILLFDKKNF